jgi:hypothetical protein
MTEELQKYKQKQQSTPTPLAPQIVPQPMALQTNNAPQASVPVPQQINVVQQQGQPGGAPSRTPIDLDKNLPAVDARPELLKLESITTSGSEKR